MKLLSPLILIAAFSPFATAQKDVVTVFLAGDSTMAPKQDNRRPETGWGEVLGAHFKDGRVRVENRAMNGRSTRSFIAEGRWQKIIDDVRKGDFVFIQFGHNDAAKDRVDRYTPPEDYKRKLVRFIEDAKAKGGNPVLLTPVMRRRFDKDGKFYDSHKEYPGIVREVAKEQKMPLIDMHKMSEVVIVRYGEEGSKKLFLQLKPGEHQNYPNGVEDNTHFSPLGAEEMAALAVEGIRKNRLRLRKYLK